MASNELFDISKSRTFRSRRASDASSETLFVGLRAISAVGEEMPAGLSVVSMLAGGFASLGTVADFISCASGEGVGAISAVVAERRLEACELPESIDDKLGDLRWPIATPPVESTLSFLLIGVEGCSAIGSVGRCDGLVPKI